MLRHAIAPAHSFAQIPNAILRHPRLSPDAKGLLNWQLSLPSGDQQCLSDTARRVGIGKTAFQKAKRQLRYEGYLHEWRTQTDGGRFVTVQLISNTPLNAKEALAVRDGLRPAPEGVRLASAKDGRPSAPHPTAGEPTGRAVGRQPEENTEENTSQPAASAPESAAEPPQPNATSESPPTGEASVRLSNAEAFLHTLGRLDPRLSLPRRTARRWAPLAAEWLDTGLARDEIRRTLSQGLDGVRSPVAVLRWRLEHALPDVSPPPPSGPRPEPRLARMRECVTRHTQPRLFIPPPGDDGDLCPDCRDDGVERPTTTAESPQTDGYNAFLAAREAERRRGRRRRPRT